jgi:hypothetical protein
VTAIPSQLPRPFAKLRIQWPRFRFLPSFGGGATLWADRSAPTTAGRHRRRRVGTDDVGSAPTAADRRRRRRIRADEHRTRKARRNGRIASVACRFSTPQNGLWAQNVGMLEVRSILATCCAPRGPWPWRGDARRAMIGNSLRANPLPSRSTPSTLPPKLVRAGDTPPGPRCSCKASPKMRGALYHEPAVVARSARCPPSGRRGAA